MLRRSRQFLESIASACGVGLEIHIAGPLPAVEADQVLLEQVLVNIIKNAAESVAASRRNEPVRLEAECVGKRVRITVTDHGTGIGPEKYAQLFTPFYTDKPGGQGIGLMTVRDILRGHGADFSLATSPDDGLTRFTITFRPLASLA